MQDFSKQRLLMLKEQIKARGVRDELVLKAMQEVPREIFVPQNVREMAYQDMPLPIAAGQTISQPYIVAYMLEALALKGGEKVLEIGAGSGYAAAVMAEIAGEVFTIERIGQLAEKAATNLIDAGYKNVHVRHSDGTIGWQDKAPFDAILVSAGAPFIPESLKQQLAIGGRLIVPVGTTQYGQELIRITRLSENEYQREELADVRFVPLIGEEGWEEEENLSSIARPRIAQKQPKTNENLPSQISNAGEAFLDVDSANLEPLMQRIGDAKVVLLGEATHGTSEFYKMRAKITKKLIKEKGFNIVAVEADWPDGARIDNYIRHKQVPETEWSAFARFPTWMWRNEEMHDFIDWLRLDNQQKDYKQRTAFYGLDLYSLYNSAREVIKYLEKIDPELAEIARTRYGCLTPWESDPAAYGHAALSGTYKSCEQEVVHMLSELFEKQQELLKNDGESFFDAVQNATLVANAERYYRIMYYGSHASWNLRDKHMFDSLQRVLIHHGEGAKAVIWAHNSHIGNAKATEMSSRGEFNIGQLCKQEWGKNCYNIGFGTDHGTLAASSNWDGPMQIMQIRPSHPQSYEHLFHLSNKPALMLDLRDELKQNKQLIKELSKPRLERAIGVIYRPETEIASHYFEAILPKQFDEYIWFDRTSAITPMKVRELEGLPDTYPFGV